MSGFHNSKIIQKALAPRKYPQQKIVSLRAVAYRQAFVLACAPLHILKKHLFSLRTVICKKKCSLRAVTALRASRLLLSLTSASSSQMPIYSPSAKRDLTSRKKYSLRTRCAIVQCARRSCRVSGVVEADAHAGRAGRTLGISGSVSMG